MDKPTIDDAPGLALRPCKYGWEARWRARADLIKRGYRPKVLRLWGSTKSQPELTTKMRQHISYSCQDLQAEMLTWARGGLPAVVAYDGTVAGLIAAYQSDADSPYRKIRYHTRGYYDTLCKRVAKDLGEKRVEEINARDMLRWHETFVATGKIAMGHACVGMLRTLTTFGATLLENKDCRELKVLLHDMKFPMAKPRTVHLTSEQAEAIRIKAHELGFPSIALAQAFQFECTLRQKDVIGEWVPLSEPGPQAVVAAVITNGDMKWQRGLRWEEIDADMVLHHVTSKRGKLTEPDLKAAPMVLDELEMLGERPMSGPVIICERTKAPWEADEFRRKWRMIADQCGIPKDVRNMDTRAGAITEATDAGADLEAVRHAATHSNIGMTQRYSRGGQEKTAGVMRLRVAFRKNNS